MMLGRGILPNVEALMIAKDFKKFEICIVVLFV